MGNSVLARMTQSGWIDISLPLRDGMVHWPGDPPVRIQRVKDFGRGDSHSLSELSLGSHTGTHIDAPAHFIKHGETVDRIPLQVLAGKARVLETKDEESIKLVEVVPYKVRRGERIIFKTKNSSLWQSAKFIEDFVYISVEVAGYLAEKRVKLVGIDYLSVGGYRRGGRTQHNDLLNAGVCIVEGLNLSQVAPGNYHLVCLPLRLENGDGAPARAIVRPYTK